MCGVLSLSDVPKTVFWINLNGGGHGPPRRLRSDGTDWDWIWVKIFFFGLHQILGRKTDWFWVKNFFLWSSLFLNFLPPPPFENPAHTSVYSDPRFLWIFLNSCPLNLLLVWSHQGEIIIVKRLIQGRNNVITCSLNRDHPIRIVVKQRLDSFGRARLPWKSTIFLMFVEIIKKIICPAFQLVTEEKTQFKSCLCICVWSIFGFSQSCDLNQKDFLSLSNQRLSQITGWLFFC